MSIRSICVSSLLAILSSVSLAEDIWIEGEAPAQQSVTRHPFWYDQVKKEELSGGDWISNWSAETPGTLTYKFNAKTAGDFTFWLRANPTGTKLSWKLNEGAEQPVSFAEEKDNRNVAADDKIDLRFLSWVKVGRVKLKAGENTVAFRLSSDNNNHGAIDAMLFTTGG